MFRVVKTEFRLIYNHGMHGLLYIGACLIPLTRVPATQFAFCILQVCSLIYSKHFVVHCSHSGCEHDTTVLAFCMASTLCGFER